MERLCHLTSDVTPLVLSLFGNIFASKKFIDKRGNCVEKVALFKVTLRLKINGMKRCDYFFFTDL